MTFYGRERELKQFQNFLNRNDVNLAVVFGRRRIGKSELIKEAVRRSDLRSIYLECRQTSEAEHVELLAELGARLLGLPGLAADKLERILDLLAQHAESEPLICSKSVGLRTVEKFGIWTIPSPFVANHSVPRESSSRLRTGLERL